MKDKDTILLAEAYSKIEVISEQRDSAFWNNWLENYRNPFVSSSNRSFEHYKRNADNTITISSSVDLKGMKLTSLTEMPFRIKHVKGSFDIRENELTSLQGCPEIVNFSFNCSKNLLTTLEGGPKEVNGGLSQDYFCSDNPNLISLKGIAQFTGGIDAQNCNLSTLDWMPEVCKGSLKINGNLNLKSLVGAPKKVESYIDCSETSIETLIGCPQEVASIFCSYIKTLISFKGAPEKLTHNEYSPTRAVFANYCDNLKSLEFLPEADEYHLDYRFSSQLEEIKKQREVDKMADTISDDPNDVFVKTFKDFSKF